VNLCPRRPDPVCCLYQRTVNSDPAGEKGSTLIYTTAGSKEICRGISTEIGTTGFIVQNTTLDGVSCEPAGLDPLYQGRFCHNSNSETFCSDLDLDIATYPIEITECDASNDRRCCLFTTAKFDFFEFYLGQESIEKISQLNEFEYYTAISDGCQLYE